MKSITPNWAQRVALLYLCCASLLLLGGLLQSGIEPCLGEVEFRLETDRDFPQTEFLASPPPPLCSIDRDTNWTELKFEAVAEGAENPLVPTVRRPRSPPLFS